MITQMYILTHILSSKEDKTTETDEAAIAAEPIQGWSTRPAGMNTPATNRGEDGVGQQLDQLYFTWQREDSEVYNPSTPAAMGIPTRL